MQHDTQRRRGPDAGHAEAANHTHRIRQSSALAPYRALAGQPSSRPIDNLLARLHNVRQHGTGYRAEGDDGRVLIRCFAGCEVADVLAALGMGLADLFPERVRDLSPLGRAQRREAARAANVAAAVAVLDRETLVVLAAVGILQRGNALTSTGHDRLALAAQRVHDVREVLR